MSKRFSLEQFHGTPRKNAEKYRRVFKIGVFVLLLAALPLLQSCDGGNGDPADDASDEGWEVWLADQSDSADISVDNPTGTYGSRIIIYESSDILAAPSGMVRRRRSGLRADRYRSCSIFFRLPLKNSAWMYGAFTACCRITRRIDT